MIASVAKYGTWGWLKSHMSPADLAEVKAKEKEFHAMRQQRLRDGDFHGYLWMFPSEQRIEPFLRIISRLSPVQYWTLLREVWIMTEVVHEHRQQWLRLFQSKRPHREALMTPKEHKALARLPDEIEIYRGCVTENGVLGLAWTLDSKRAEFFTKYACEARRGLLTPRYQGTTPIVVAATCRRSDVLAHFIERKESEIIVNLKRVAVQFAWPLAALSAPSS
jgi:hypothetical protein